MRPEILEAIRRQSSPETSSEPPATTQREDLEEALPHTAGAPHHHASRRALLRVQWPLACVQLLYYVQGVQAGCFVERGVPCTYVGAAASAKSNLLLDLLTEIARQGLGRMGPSRDQLSAPDSDQAPKGTQNGVPIPKSLQRIFL